MLIIFGVPLAQSWSRTNSFCPSSDFGRGPWECSQYGKKKRKKKIDTDCEKYYEPTIICSIFASCSVFSTLSFDHQMTGALITHDPMKLNYGASRGSSQQWYITCGWRGSSTAPLTFAFSVPSPEAPLMGLRIKISPTWLIQSGELGKRPFTVRLLLILTCFRSFSVFFPFFFPLLLWGIICLWFVLGMSVRDLRPTPPSKNAEAWLPASAEIGQIPGTILE